jgi:hypothetical protein
VGRFCETAHTSGGALAPCSIRLSKIGRPGLQGGLFYAVAGVFTKRTRSAGQREFLRHLRFTKRTGRLNGSTEEGVDLGHGGEFLAAVIGAELLCEAFSDGAPIDEAMSGDVGAGVEGFVAVLPMGLEEPEFGGAFVKETMGLGAGAVDGELDFGLGFVLHGVGGIFGREVFFDDAAATETPHSAAHLIDDVVFEEADRSEVMPEGCVEFVVEGLFAGADEIVEGKEAWGWLGVFGRQRSLRWC